MTTRKPASAPDNPAAAPPRIPLPLPVPVARPVSPGQQRPSAPVPAKGFLPAQPARPPAAVTPQVANGNSEVPPADVTKVAIQGAPPWLVSLVVHMVLMLVLALIWIPVKPENIIEIVSEVVLAEQLGEQTLNDELQSPAEMNLAIDPALALDDRLVEDPFSSPPIYDITLLDPNRASDALPTPVIGSPLSGREEGGKRALLAAYGGTETTEAAVREGLLWLKRNQKKDGTWSLLGPYADGKPYNDNIVAATAMALLAFQGAGHTHASGEFKDVVAKGWGALLKMQNADGFFECESAYNDRLYAQGQATIALCEIYGMTQDKNFREPARLAVDWALAAQSPSGGWRYVPKEDSDTSVTGWYVMALQSAMMGYLNVDPKALEKISSYLDSAGRDDQSRYAYQSHVTDPSVTMTAEALLCRQYLGWKHDDERLRRGVDYLLDNKIDYKAAEIDVYYWYYATQVLHHMDGSDWNEWNAVMREEVPRQQVKSGPEKGSWSPSKDKWGGKAGRLYQTCLSIYMLEVYYRHLPIYKYRLN